VTGDVGAGSLRVAPPSEAQAAALQASLGTCNRAASWFATLHSWAFAQLGAFLGYKAQAAGVAFVQVDPSYSSQTCHGCGWVDKRNRRSQSEFECGRCGFVGLADHNAAINNACRVSNARAKSCAHTQRRP
jgi:transposase